MIRILCDSSSDYSIEEADNLGIGIVPMHITFDDGEYLDQVTLSFDKFYEKLEKSNNLPKTSQINPFSWEEKINQYPDDEILIITISSVLSGTYKSACIAIQDHPNCRVVDSLNVTAGVKLLVDRAIKLISEGKTIDEIADTLNEEKKQLRLHAVLDTLKYLKKGGRISSTVAFVGGILGIKAMIEIKDGAVNFLDKAHGTRSGFRKIKEYIDKNCGIDYDKGVYLAYTGNSTDMIERYIESSQEYLNKEQYKLTRVGATIGTHIGPGAIAIAYFANK